MIFEDRVTGPVLTVRPLAKRIDASGAANFKGHFTDWIGEGRRLIVLDLAEVDFIDSSGLVAIVSVLKTITPEGELAICCMRESVMSLFRLTRMNRVFRIFGSREQAVEALAGPKGEQEGARPC
jgi:anti-sigma B factor antagonist